MIDLQGMVQIAGIRSLAEARLCLDAGVDLLGFPLRLDVHAPDLDEARAADLIRRLDRAGHCVCITYETDPAALAGLCARLGVAAVQLHAPVATRDVAELRRLSPDLFVIKSLVVGRSDIDGLLHQVDDFAPLVQAFITDTFDPDTGASGATGRTHDWAVSRRLKEVSPLPVILAGGLTPDNVSLAIEAVRPAAVDAHTGVEDRKGWKDPAKVRAFVRRAKAAFALLGP